MEVWLNVWKCVEMCGSVEKCVEKCGGLSSDNLKVGGAACQLHRLPPSFTSNPCLLIVSHFPPASNELVKRNCGLRLVVAAV